MHLEKAELVLIVCMSSPQPYLLELRSTFVCSIDFKKAFDSVNSDLLQYRLLKSGINGKFYFAKHLSPVLR